MNYTDLVNPAVLTQPVYVPGKPIEQVAREYGLKAEETLKLASNENPLGPSPKAMEAASRAIVNAHLYPDGNCTALREKLAAKLGVGKDQLLFGNGSNEIFELLGHAFLRPGVECVMGAQAFIVYKLVTLLFGAKVVEVPMPDHRHDLMKMADAVTEKTRVVFLPSPNNPTGTANFADAVIDFAKHLPEDVLFVFDEAYAEYEDNGPDLRPLISEGRKILCTRTFSKIYGLAAFRIGYGYGSPELIALLERVRQPFNVNGIAQAAALGALDDDDFVTTSRQINRVGRAQLRSAFQEMGLDTMGEAGNFVMVKVPEAAEAFKFLQKRGVIVRPLDVYGLPDWLRVTIGTPDQNSRALDGFRELLQAAPTAPNR